MKLPKTFKPLKYTSPSPSKKVQLYTVVRRRYLHTEKQQQYLWKCTPATQPSAKLQTEHFAKHKRNKTVQLLVANAVEGNLICDQRKEEEEKKRKTVALEGLLPLISISPLGVICYIVFLFYLKIKAVFIVVPLSTKWNRTYLKTGQTTTRKQNRIHGKQNATSKQGRTLRGNRTEHYLKTGEITASKRNRTLLENGTEHC